MEDLENKNVITEEIISNLKSKYGDINHLQRYEHIDSVNFVIKELMEEMEKIEYLFMRNVNQYIGHTLCYSNFHIYGINIPMAIDYDDYYIRESEYMHCIFNWYEDFKEHLKELDILISADAEDLRVCIFNCYFELKILGKKLLYAIDNSLQIPEYLKIFEFEEEDKQRLENAVENVYFEEIRKLLEVYEDIYYKVCEMGNYIFCYINEYGA